MKIPSSKSILRSALLTGTLCLIPTVGLASTHGAGPELLFNKNQQWQLPYTPVDMVQSVDGKHIFVLTDNHKLLIYEPNGVLKGSVDVDPGVVAIDTDRRGENVLLIDKDMKTFSSYSIDFVAEIDITGAPFKGKADAPVTMVVFTDFE